MLNSLHTGAALHPVRSFSMALREGPVERQANRVERIVVPDPDREKTRQQCEALKSVVSFRSTQVVNQDQTAIRAIQQLPADAARSVCEAVGIKDREYRQISLSSDLQE
jgi:hypothetical protein